mmetsp:Transcript_20401/g.54936  ORF Transcript_20401/g.54936 Transcript_20401/m.54936 type:complete len:215 (-) Transcript_20401:314-958(-)
MVTRPPCRWTSPSQTRPPTPTGAQSSSSSRSSRTCTSLTTSGTSPCCATSTPWAPTPRDSWARTPRASPTTSCPSSSRWPLASGPSSPSSGMTTPPTTARACVTTSTSSTWPWGTWPRCASSLKSLAPLSSTWAPARATRCWTWSRPLRRRVARPSPTRLRHDARETWPWCTRTRPRRRISSAGRRNGASRICARPRGNGSPTIPTAMAGPNEV